MPSPLFRIGEYLRYRQQARGIQYIHSPFLFQLMKDCFYDAPHDMFLPIETIRKNLLRDNQQITRTDLGAGNTGKIAIESVKQIARKSLQPSRNARLLYRLAKHLEAKNILELGTSFGITTSYISLATDNGIVTTIEGDPAIQARAAAHFKKLGIHNIQSICGDFDTELPKMLSTSKPLDLVWIDGNHRKEATLRYFNMIIPHMQPTGIMIFDDIHWSREMAEAWNIIRRNEQVTLTIDIFQMGLVFLSNTLSKEHRVLKYPL